MKNHEEMGAEVVSLHDLGILYPNTGLEGSAARLFLAKLIKVGKVDAAEGIGKLEYIDQSQFMQMIAYGEINDAYTIAAFCRAHYLGFV